MPNAKQKQQLHIYYDGECPMCQNFMAYIDSTKNGKNLDRTKIQEQNKIPQNLSDLDLFKEIHVVDETGKVYKNYFAILRILETYNYTKLLVFLGRLPLISHLGVLVYKFVAANRYKFFKKTS